MFSRSEPRRMAINLPVTIASGTPPLKSFRLTVDTHGGHKDGTRVDTRVDTGLVAVFGASQPASIVLW